MRDDIDVFCVGETMVMVTASDGGPLSADGRYLLRPGGAESNVASALASLGHATRWASALGDDPLGDIVLSDLARNGVDLGLVVRDPLHRTGVFFKNPSPEGTKVHYYRDGSAASMMSVELVKQWSPARAGIVHVSGITAALSDDCRELLQAIIIDRALGDAVVSFDVNYRPALWPTTRAAPELLRLARASDIVFVGRDEAETLWGTSTAASVDRLLQGPAHLVVKDGALDATEFHDGGATVCAAPVVEVVEPVGAGDAFASGWLAGRLRAADADERLRFGHLMASRVLRSSTDAAPAPSQAEIAHALAHDPRDWRRSTSLVEG